MKTWISPGVAHAVLMAQWKPSGWTCMSADMLSLLQLRLGMFVPGRSSPRSSRPAEHSLHFFL